MGKHREAIGKFNDKVGVSPIANIKSFVQVALTVGLFSVAAPNYAQTTSPANDSTKKPVPESSKQNDSTKKSIPNLSEKNDSLEHQRIINMNVDSLLMEYGQEKGMEIIREHMLIEINKVRTAQGKQALVQNDTLNRIAQDYSQYMNENDRYSHSDKEGHNANRRIENAGKKFGKNRIVKGGENIAKNYHTVGSVLDGWLNHSAGHRANILFVDRKEIGIGYDNGYWTQDFY